MAEFETPKFQVGQKVKFINDTDHEAGNIVGFSFDVDKGWTYKITSKEVDFEKKEVINGFKICHESELVEVEEETPEENGDSEDE